MSKKVPHIVVFTGAGVSAESGLGTFRDLDGLWNNYRIEEVCTHEAWLNNPETCVQFYNERRRETLKAMPNDAHLALAELEKDFSVDIITQNIDNLHERAGSSHITHLHGEITKLRSSNDELATVSLDGWEQHYGDRHPDGSLLRPYIVFFDENVPLIGSAQIITMSADIFIVIGTSFVVYPAASLIQYVPKDKPIYVVDPATDLDLGRFASRVEHICEKATIGVPRLCQMLKEKYL